jgi:1,2-dihydroxy-3-keto-5-methylthiopentene dioxygenase
MTVLTRWKDNDPDTVVFTSSDPEAIAADLQGYGIRYEQWPLDAQLGPSPTQDEVFAAFKPSIDKLVAETGYSTMDVAQIHPSDDPSWAETAAGARGRFLSEHTHGEDEIRFFVGGSGVFYLHIGDDVIAVLCEAGDLLSVPALTTHWFDMGTRPDFIAIRFFQNPDGWVGTFTGSPIAESFATYDQLAAR